MKKVRVFELAKEFGMKGPELAKLLREIGFEKVKTHMTALDEADLMMVEGALSAQGLQRKAAGAGDAGGAPKKRSLTAAAEASEDGVPGKKTLKKKSLPEPAAKRKLTKVSDEPESPAAPAKVAAEQPAKAAKLPPEPAAAKPAQGAAGSKPAPKLAEPKPAAVKPAAVKPAAEKPAEPKPAAAKPAAPEPATPRPAAPPPAAKPPAAKPAAAPAATTPAAATPAKPAVAASATDGAATQPEPVAQPKPAAAKQPAAAQAQPEPKTETPAPAPSPSADKPAAGSPAGSPAGAGTAPPAAAGKPAAKTPAAAAAGGKPAAGAPVVKPAAAGPAPTGPGGVRKLLVPQKKATVVGRIELPQETIRDATRRSAPAAPRDLRRAALQKMQQRGSMRQMPGQHRRGPGGRGGGRGGPGGKGKQRTAPPVDPSKLVEVQEPVSLKALSSALGVPVPMILMTLMSKLKIMGKNINSLLSNDEVELIGLELNRNVKVVEHKEAMDELIEELVEESEGQEAMLRAPVVTFMGHVDHGKTSLMDALRSSEVTKHEAGGITQHIGAYKVQNSEGQPVVVLDTPGHAAFTAMRARGAEITDVVVLVVAADDGVMPQTEEAISHAKAAKCPIVVAITKCDLPGANAMQVKQQLMIKGLQSEDFGGEIGAVECSSKTGQGLDALVERIHLEAELLDLNARPDAAARGVVVESRQSAAQGVVVTLLVTDGTLRVKDQIVCGESFARVRAMIDDHGDPLVEAGPSTPVTLFGLDRLPSPGDKLFVVENAKKAKEVVEERQRREREMARAERSAVTLETLSAKLAEKDIREIKIILKADAMGSLEPVRKSLDDLATEEVRVNLVHSGLGGINKADVDLAATSEAVIVGFNTVADSNVRQLATEQEVEIRYYEIIYKLIDDVKDALEGLLAPEEVESVIGHAEVKAIFKSSKIGTIAGCRVLDGVAKRGCITRLSRDGRVVWSGKLSTLRRIDDDVKEVKQGFECGMTLDGFNEIKEGDQLEFVQIDLIKRTLGG
ncbi:MAG: translation initiation factor IF-2 [Planctomycetota bacterium]